MGREDLAGVEGDDRDLLLIDDGQDPPAGIERAGIEMVEAAGELTSSRVETAPRPRPV